MAALHLTAAGTRFGGGFRAFVLLHLAIAGGIGSVTLPVAAHSAPRVNVVTNAGVWMVGDVMSERRGEDATLP